MTLLRSALPFALILFLISSCFAAQAGSGDDIFTISVAAPTSAKDVQVRYFFTGEFGGHGSSTADPTSDGKIVIKTAVAGKSAKTFKLIAYAPGCQLVLMTVDDLSTSNRQGEFQCQKLSTLQLQGRLDVLDLTQHGNLQVQALYVCNWAMPFFGISQGAISPISLGKASVATDGTFTIDLPDLANDPTWPRLSEDAGFLFVLSDAKSGKHLATLSSLSDTSRGGVIPVAGSYPQLEFTTQARDSGKTLK
jgi:hypothetical protein